MPQLSKLDDIFHSLTEPATPLHQTPALSTIYTEPTPTVTPHGRHPT